MASAERGWEEAISRAVQVAVRSVQADREATASAHQTNSRQRRREATTGPPFILTLTLMATPQSIL
jgi:hypothetical protein